MNIKENYHTHTELCKHATGNVDDYARIASEEGAEVLAFTDHVPFPDDRWRKVRMSMGELSYYEDQIAQAVEKYPHMNIIKGAECEYDVEYEDYFRSLREEKGFKCLVAGLHWFPFEGEWIGIRQIKNAEMLHAYSEHAVKAIKSGLFNYLAHPDVFGYVWSMWDEDSTAASLRILEAAEACKVPLELNGYGLRKKKVPDVDGERRPYPMMKFWELAEEYNITVICNSDAHRPEDVLASIDECREIADKFNLKVLTKPKEILTL
jgi:histidinol-phosphatase (PHP family)